VLDPLAQPVRERHLELEFGDDAEHPDGDLCRVQEVGLVLTDLEDLSPGGHHPQAPDAGGEAPEA